jgi:hypothetical protein
VGRVKKVILIIAMLVLLSVALVSAEISVSQENSHSFLVNTLSSSTPTIPQQTVPGMSIVIQQLNAARIISPCEQANFSFKITNQNSVQKIYSFSVDEFEGTAFITPNIMLNPKETKIIDFILTPECSSTTILNPKVHVETDDEEAEIPVIININGTYVDSDSCSYYYDNTICNSPYYIRVAKGETYVLDLSKWFYDPDTDKLEYSFTKSANLDIEISGNKAKIKAREDWQGTEKILFYANDGKGGKAESKMFYIHVVSEEASFWNKLISFLGF